MKKMFFMLAAVVLLMGCSKDDEQVSNKQKETVTFTFPQFQTSVEPMTRTTDVSTLVTHIDVWITDGTTTTDIHQVSTDDGYGTITADLNRNTSYTIYAVAHKAEGATLTDGVIAFTDDKVTHAMFYSTTFTPSTTTELSCMMNRIVGQFRMETTDAVPDGVEKFRFLIPQTFTRWNVNGTGANAIDRTSDIRVSSRGQDGTVAINIYIIGSADQQLYDITVQALDANGDVVENGQRTFDDVPIRNNYKTVMSGAYFVPTSVSLSLAVNDWETYTTVNF